MFRMVKKTISENNRYQNSINIFTSNLIEKKSPKDSNICKIGLTLEFFSYLCVAFILISFSAIYTRFNAPFYSVETDYKKWVSNLPAYTVCPEVNSSIFVTKFQKLLKISDDKTSEFVVGLLNPAEKYCQNCANATNNKNLRFPKVKYKKITEEVSQLCEGLLLSCFWNDKPFQCCQFFQKIPTDRGICFSLNSLHTRDPGNVPNDMITTYTQPNAILTVEASTPIKIYIHDKKELNFQLIHNLLSIIPGKQGKILYKFEEVIEDDSSWLLSLDQRNCVLTNEINMNNFKIYSESACLLQCTARKQLDLCKCKHHLLPGSANECGFNGLKCLDRNRKKFNNSEDCECLQDCSYTEVNLIQYSMKTFWKQTALATVELSKAPTERIKLIAQITKLDVIVALACFSRLITNATFDEMLFQLYYTAKEFFLMIKNIWKKNSPLKLKPD